MLRRRGKVWYYGEDEPVSPRPHPLTVLTSLASPALAGVALILSIISLFETEKSQRLQQRAYLSVLGGSLDRYSTQVGQFDGKVTIFNAGNTPGDLTEVTVEVRGDVGRAEYFRKIYDEKSNPVSVDGRSQVTKQFRVAIPSQEFRSLQTSEVLSFTFHAKYRDNYGDKTDLVWRWTVPPVHSGNNTIQELH